MAVASTGDSGAGSDVEKVREATRLVKERAPQLPVEGPIQYDAAVDAGVAKSKLPGSKVAGSATVLVFPDLNSGNIAYKLTQYLAGATAIGPLLQGFAHPISDLSRGASVSDIIAATAICLAQVVTAQQEERLADARTACRRQRSRELLATGARDA